MTRAWLVPVAASLMLLLADDNAMAQTVPAEAQNRELIIGSQIGWTLLSLSFLQAVLALLGIAVVVAVLIWIFERRHNEEFGGGTLRGIGSSMWGSAEAMTQAMPFSRRSRATGGGRPCFGIWGSEALSYGRPLPNCRQICEIKAVKEETKQVWRYVGCHQE